MSYRDKLRQWFNSQRAEGLRDVKFFVGESPDLSIEQASERVYNIVTEQCETVDITDKFARKDA